MSMRSASASGDQNTAMLSLVMLRACAPYHVFYVDGFAGSRVERADALLDIAAQTTELLDIGAQLLANLLLICLWQRGRLGDRVVEHLAHLAILPQRRAGPSQRALHLTAPPFHRARCGDS